MVLVVLVIAIAMLFAILSSFLPFSNAYGNIVQYTSAYYSAISAIERGSLAIRYAGPGFDGESGWKYDGSDDGHYNTGNASDNWIEDFVSYGRAGDTTLYWNVKSKTSSIPKNGEGDVDPSFIDASINPRSIDFNVMNYYSAVLIPLGKVGVIDPTRYYSDYGNYGVDNNFAGINANFRINPYLYNKVRNSSPLTDQAAKLCDKSCPGSSDDSMDKRTPIVDWVIKGIYLTDPTNPNGEEVEVSILPSDGSDVGSSYYVHEARDSLIRKPNIGHFDSDQYGGWGTDVLFSTYKNPIKKEQGRLSQLNIISRKSSELKSINNGDFVDIIKAIKNPQISLELINYLWSQGSGNSMQAHHLYPFLEYRVESLGGEFSDLFYTIKGEGRVGKYDVRLQIKKPTLKDSSLGNFTIIF